MGYSLVHRNNLPTKEVMEERERETKEWLWPVPPLKNPSWLSKIFRR